MQSGGRLCDNAAGDKLVWTTRDSGIVVARRMSGSYLPPRWPQTTSFSIPYLFAAPNRRFFFPRDYWSLMEKRFLFVSQSGGITFWNCFIWAISMKTLGLLLLISTHCARTPKGRFKESFTLILLSQPKYLSWNLQRHLLFSDNFAQQKCSRIFKGVAFKLVSNARACICLCPCVPWRTGGLLGCILATQTDWISEGYQKPDGS